MNEISSSPIISMDDFKLSDVVIRSIKESEVNGMPRWIYENVGWLTSTKFLVCNYRIDPKGWLIAHHPKFGIIGNVFCFNLNDQYSVGGAYIVKSEFRNIGIGKLLWENRIKHIGDRLLTINAIETRVKTNLKLGMTYPLFTIKVMKAELDRETWIRTNKLITTLTDPKLDSGMIGTEQTSLQYLTINPKNLLTTQLFDMISKYDQSVHFLEREAYLEDHIFDLEAFLDGKFISVVVIETAHVSTGAGSAAVNEYNNNSQFENIKNGYVNLGKGAKIRGFGFLSQRYHGYSVSPLYADNDVIATKILFTLLAAGINNNSRSERKTKSNANPPERFEVSKDQSKLCDDSKITVETVLLEFKENTSFGKLLKHAGFITLDQTYRMYYHKDLNSTKDIPPLPPVNLNKVYALTSPDAFLV